MRHEKLSPPGCEIGAVLWWFDSTAAPGWQDWMGLLLGAAGLGYTAVQARNAKTQATEAKSAAQSAASALLDARNRLTSEQLAAVLPHIETIIADLDFAIVNNDREVAQRALRRFSSSASESVAVLSNMATAHDDLVTRLQSASATALDVKGTIVGHKNPDIARLAKAITAEINAISADISLLTATDRYSLGESTSV